VQANGGNLTVVPVNGQNINSYPVTIPQSTPGVSHYLTWTESGSTYTFQTETNVAIAKLNLLTTAAGSFSVTCPDASQNQTVTVALYNDNFEPASATDSPQTAYGSVVLYVRTLPTWQAGKTTVSDNGSQWQETFTPKPAAVSMSLYAYPDDLKWWMSCTLDYTGQIFSTIANGTASNMNMTLNWNGTASMTYVNWKPSGSGNSGAQYLICGSNKQQSTKNGQAMSMTKVTLSPNTATNVVYEGELKASGSPAYGDTATLNAYLSSLEIVPAE